MDLCFQLLVSGCVGEVQVEEVEFALADCVFEGLECVEYALGGVVVVVEDVDPLGLSPQVGELE